MDSTTTHFGFAKVTKQAKDKLVAGVFNSVAKKYDLMNDVMSLGIHRLWKKIAIEHCAILPKQTILDLAAGTGDLTRNISACLNDSGQIVLADINHSMLEVGRQRLIDLGLIKNLTFIQANGETLPFADNLFDCVVIGFGLRNFTNKDLALSQMYRVLKPGGRVVILEFSKPTNNYLHTVYDLYSFNILPKLGKILANDEHSYRYLAESIRMHPAQQELQQMLENANFEKTSYHNLSGGICAIHKGFKF